MATVTLNVPHVQQETGFLCGPAAVQMVLASRGVQPPPAPPSWQQQLFTDVKAQTLSRRPQGGSATFAPTDCPSFRSQKCERCPGLSQLTCWCATPQALSRVMNLRAPGTGASVHKFSDDRAASARIVQSIDANVAPVVLKRGLQHWIVVFGYRENAAGLPSRMLAGKAINGFYVHDPLRPSSVAPQDIVGITEWLDEFLTAVPCGTLRTFRDKYVMVGAQPARRRRRRR